MSMLLQWKNPLQNTTPCTFPILSLYIGAEKEGEKVSNINFSPLLSLSFSRTLWFLAILKYDNVWKALPQDNFFLWKLNFSLQAKSVLQNLFFCYLCFLYQTWRVAALRSVAVLITHTQSQQELWLSMQQKKWGQVKRKFHRWLVWYRKDTDIYAVSREFLSW